MSSGTYNYYIFIHNLYKHRVIKPDTVQKTLLKSIHFLKSPIMWYTVILYLHILLKKKEIEILVSFNYLSKIS